MTLTHTERIARMKRAPVRISITLPFMTYQALESHSTFEGRSLSNLCAYLLQRDVEALAQQPVQDRLTYRPDRSKV
jgi:hypothetical protein